MARSKRHVDSVDLERYGIDLNRLTVAMARSRKILQRYRTERKEAVRQDVGSHYSDDGARQRVPVNLIGLYEQIVGTALLSQAPQFMLSTFNTSMRPAVEAMNSWVNRHVKRIGLTETLQRIISDALYCIGIGKVALATPTDAATLSWGIRAGEPLLSSIDLDDWVYDTQAYRFEEVAFMGHRFRCPLDAVKDSRWYNPAVSKLLAPSENSRYNLDGDERISQIGKGLWWSQDDAEDMVDLWEIYLPRHRLVVTMANDLMLGPALMQSDGRAEPLRVQNWIGPDRGPYHLLCMKTVGGNAMPRSPVMNLIDMHDIANRTLRKLTDQADRQKTNVWYNRNDGDAERIARAKDGELIPVDRPDMVKETRLGGPDQANFAFFEEILNRFSWLAGNLDILGGLSPQAKTLGQDKMLNQNSSRVVSGMQDRTVEYVSKVGEALIWYWWKDPYRVYQAPYSPRGMNEVQVERQVHPAHDGLRDAGATTRHGPIEELAVQVDPYSLPHQTPQEKIGAIDQLVTQVIIPMMPMLQASGMTFNIEGYLKLKARLQNLPELEDIITMGAAVPQDPSTQSGPAAPTQTERRYVRENRSERTNQGTTQSLINKLSGVEPGGNPDKS